MGRGSRSKRENAGCRVCLGDHDDEIHQATLRVRQWFRHEVLRKLDGIVEDASEAA
jgi:hypothetical protein